MYRVIIRFSWNSDNKSKVRNHIQAVLGKYGIQNTKTGTWESAQMELNEATLAIVALMEVIADPRAKVDAADENVALDHVWIYIDGA